MFALVAVTIEPSFKVGKKRERTSPFLSFTVELQQIKLLPPFERYAPMTKSSCPPAPEIWRLPELSLFTCPKRSISTAELIETKLSCAAILAISFV